MCLAQGQRSDASEARTRVKGVSLRLKVKIQNGHLHSYSYGEIPQNEKGCCNNLKQSTTAKAQELEVTAKASKPKAHNVITYKCSSSDISNDIVRL